ncbi:MAG TPA: nitrous oxide reductase family maturation protein NosD [Gemmatimonadaceae bacterium]|nr:nitrous oxide reductase family maturation protein NosD [Gemmatimonadaceae bacterium]
MRPPAILFALCLVCGSASAQQTITVSPSGKLRSITAAIAAARPHDRIVIKTGVYREPTIVVAKPVEITGEGFPVLDGQSARPIMVITADSVTVHGIHFRRVGTSFVEDWAALRVENAKGCSLENNLIDDAFFGIYLARVSQCSIKGNVVRGRNSREMASGNGIHIWQSSQIDIARNRISGHRDGIYFEFVRNSTIAGNVSEKNLRYGLHFMFSDDCRYTANVFRSNGAGVAVMFTRRVEMIGNRFENNWGSAAYGLLLKEISDSRLERNVFSRNTVGLVADGANRLRALENQFSDNGWAVKLEASTDEALFTRNNFTDNTFDVSTNSTQPSAKFAGNYWQDYAGYDLDRNGIGDVPFRPVRLFSVIVAHNSPTIILLRSPFVRLLDTAERIIPALTPELLADASPAMRRFRW